MVRSVSDPSPTGGAGPGVVAAHPSGKSDVRETGICSPCILHVTRLFPGGQVKKAEERQAASCVIRGLCSLYEQLR